jgi:hypothetical protein
VAENGPMNRKLFGDLHRVRVPHEQPLGSNVMITIFGDF